MQRRNRRLSRVALASAAAGAALLISRPASAGTVYWDTNGTTSGTATAGGIWDANTTANWTTDSAGSIATGKYGDLSGTDAVFSAGTNSTGANAITINGSVTATSIKVEEGYLTFSGAATPVLNLGTGGINIASTANTSNNTTFGTTINSIVLTGSQSWDVNIASRTLATSTSTAITGNFALTINNSGSAGTVQLSDQSGLSNFNGGVTIKGGTLAIGSNANTNVAVSAAGTGTITLDSSLGDVGLKYYASSNATKTYNNAIVIASGGSGTATITGNTGSAAATFNGNITMNKGLILAGSSSGGQQIGLPGTSATLATNGNQITINSTNTGGWMFNSPITGGGAMVINQSVAVGGGRSVLFQNSNPSWNGPITINDQGYVQMGAFSFSTYNDYTGSGAITMNGTSKVGIYTTSAGGYQMNNSKITVGSSGSATLASVSTSSGGYVNYAPVELGAGASLGLSVTQPGASLVVRATTLNSDTTVTVTGTQPLLGSSPNLINFVGGITGNYKLTKAGTGPLTISASTLAVANIPAQTGVAASYGGDTDIQAGWLRMGRTNALPTATKVSLASGAFLDLSVGGNSSHVTTANFDLQIGALGDYAGAGGMVVGNSSGTSLAGTKTLTVDGSTSTSFSGGMADRFNTGTASLGLTKAGTGTLSLSGPSTYSGLTTLSGGILAVSADGTDTATVATPLGFNRTANSWNASSTSITVVGAQANGVTAGMKISGGQIAAGTTVASVSGDTVNLSVATNTTSQATTATVTFLAGAATGNNSVQVNSTAGLKVGQAVTIPGWASGLVVASVIDGVTINVTSLNPSANNFTANSVITGVTPLSANTKVFFSGGTLQHAGVNATDYSGRFATASGQAYSIDTNGNDVSYATALTSSGGTLAKLGAGRLTLTQTETYGGLSSIGTAAATGGTLRVNGSLAGGVNVNFGTLDGTGDGVATGLIGGAVTVGDGLGTGRDAFLAPGNSIGTIKLASATFGTDGQLNIELNDAGSPTVDLLNVTGALDITNGAVDFAVTGTPTASAYVFATYGSLTGGAFAATSNVPAGYTIDYAYSGNQIALVPVPEPTGLGLLGIAAAGFLGRRRRK